MPKILACQWELLNCMEGELMVTNDVYFFYLRLRLSGIMYEVMP